MYAIRSYYAEHLRLMSQFMIHTGTRDQEVCQLQWDWEIPIPEIDSSVFLIPSNIVKNKLDRLVVLNSKAREVLDQVRGTHERYVFTYKGQPVKRMLNSAWLRARKIANLPQVRVHDLKHT